MINLSLTNVRLSRFSFYYETSYNWEYYNMDHWRVEDGTLIMTFKLIDPVSTLRMTLNWSDSSNASANRKESKRFIRITPAKSNLTVPALIVSAQ